MVVAMAVGFLGKATEAVDALAVLQGGVGVAVVIGPLCLFLKFSKETEGWSALVACRFPNRLWSVLRSRTQLSIPIDVHDRELA